MEAGYGKVHVLHGISVEVPQGKVVTLIGSNGAGKTTLMDLISGKTRSTVGTVHLYDTNITNWAEPRIARAGIGRKFQVPSVFRDMTVRRNLEVASCRNPAVFANLGFGLRPAARNRLDQVLEMVGLTGEADTVAGTLSHGQTQWLELGLLIAQDPKVLLLDEPTAGMTAAETQRTVEIINGLRGSHTTIVVEHDMAFVRAIAETITVLHLGKVLAEGDIASIERNPLVRDASLGTQVLA